MRYRPAMTTQKISVALLAALTLSLSACGGGSATSAEPPPSATESAASPTPEVPTSGPATTPAPFSGVSAKVLSVETRPAEAWVTGDHPGHDTWVTVHIQLTATSDAAYHLVVDPLGSTGPKAQLLYGPSQQKAQGYAANNGDTTDAPSQVAPGSPVELVREFSLPASGLSDLRLDFTPDVQRDPIWTFTGVQALI